MELLEIAKRRKTIRIFKKESPPLDNILYCIKVVREAPSGMNAQPWRFLIVGNEEKKEGNKAYMRASREKILWKNG